MGNPIVHFEIRADDPDAARVFYGKLFGWEYPAGGMPGYTYVESGVPGAIPGGIGPTQGGSGLVTVFVGVDETSASLDPENSIHTAGGRLHSVDELPAMLGPQFPYVVFEPAGLPTSIADELAAAGYKPIFTNPRAEILALN